jgi:hypothetical protein
MPAWMEHVWDERRHASAVASLRRRLRLAEVRAELSYRERRAPSYLEAPLRQSPPSQAAWGACHWSTLAGLGTASLGEVTAVTGAASGAATDAACHSTATFASIDIRTPTYQLAPVQYRLGVHHSRPTSDSAAADVGSSQGTTELQASMALQSMCILYVHFGSKSSFTWKCHYFHGQNNASSSIL